MQVIKNLSMPFTISHAVLAPPISKLTGHRLPISAIAIGCMVPDLLRLFSSDNIHTTHLWSSLLYPNLLIGIGFYLTWHLIFRSAAFRFFGIDKPIAFHSLKQVVYFTLYIVLSLIIGIASHLIWDGLTHVDFRTFALQNFLKQNITLFNHAYPMHRFLQIGTSIITLPILALMAKAHCARYQQKYPVAPKIKTYALGLLMLSFFAGCYGYIDFAQALDEHCWQHGLYEFVGKAINHFFRYSLLTFGIGCLIFQFLDSRQYFD